MGDGAENLVGRRLQTAIDLIVEHAALVELRASALSGFAQPIPPYDLDDKYRLGALRNQARIRVAETAARGPF